MECSAHKPTTIHFVSALVCVLALILPTGVANASGQSAQKDEYCDFLVVSDASIHSGPGTLYPTIGTLSDGEIVTALLRPIQGFHLLGQGGYVAKVHVQLIDEPARCGS